MSKIRIHVLHTGEVCVAPGLPFGGDDCNIIKASGVLTKKSDRLWLPVSAYYIEHPLGKILVDCGWHREMSPNGVLDTKAQIKSLGSPILYQVNQGRIEKGASIDEQLATLGVRDSDLDFVLLTHLDCDHVSGLKQVARAKHILVSSDELRFAEKYGAVRYQKRWWDGVSMTAFDWNGAQGPAGKSYDLLGDGSVVLINIPGHSDGLFAVKVVNEDGKFVLLFSDGGYAARSWEELLTSGIAADKAQQKASLAWIREQSLDASCVESLANHDPEIRPHVIDL